MYQAEGIGVWAEARIELDPFGSVRTEWIESRVFSDLAQVPKPYRMNLPYSVRVRYVVLPLPVRSRLFGRRVQPSVVRTQDVRTRSTGAYRMYRTEIEHFSLLSNPIRTELLVGVR